MLRNATESDIPRITEIRALVRENRLRDPSKVTPEDILWFINNPGIFAWEENDSIAGFSAADPCDGSIFALFMDHAFEGRGIAPALFRRACQVLMDNRCERQSLTTWPGTRAAQFYRKAGWVEVGVSEGQLRLRSACFRHSKNVIQPLSNSKTPPRQKCGSHRLATVRGTAPANAPPDLARHSRSQPAAPDKSAHPAHRHF
jgi:GNAT superfamily N-acetyltransferase